MVATRRAAAVAVLLSGIAAAAGDTPMTKVLDLLGNLKTQVEEEGAAEAKEYDTYACFCKAQTEARSASIVGGKEETDTLSASIAEDTALKVTKADELEERKKKHEEMEADLAATKKQLAKDKGEYEFAAADLSKALSSLQGAIDALQDAKTPPAAVLLSLRNSVSTGSEIARALDAKLPKGDKAFLQGKSKVDPTSAEYKYHSDGIVSTLQELQGDFDKQKQDLDIDWSKTKLAAEGKITALEGEISNNDAAMTSLDIAIEELKVKIASFREGLVSVDALLKDDQLYLKDLTKQCEARANDWDQRSKMRSDELTAISGALEILTSKVKGLDSDVNQRALLQEPSATKTVPAKAGKLVSFVQTVSVRSHSQGEAQLSEAQQHIVDFIAKEGRRLKSPQLAMLAMHLAADPFAKVKDMIQELIERLLKESTAEAGKEGYCKTALGKAEQDRDFRFKDVRKLNTDAKQLELKKDELESEIEELTDAIASLEAALQKATEMRETEHGQNMVTISKAKEGLEAVTEAIVILKTFYKQSAKAVALVQASPLDEDTSGPGFEGNYGGKQDSAKGIIGMLEVIKTDFQRTVKVTTDNEKKAHSDFVEFDRVSRTDISAKSKKKELDEEDLSVTKATLAEKMSSLQNNMDLLDTALQTLLELKPMCTDFGMSYEDRVKKRQDEIDALKKAICELGGSC